MTAQRKHQQPGQQLVRVHVSNAHRTSGGAGPGVVEVPLDEAEAVVARRHGRILGPAAARVILRQPGGPPRCDQLIACVKRDGPFRVPPQGRAALRCRR